MDIIVRFESSPKEIVTFQRKLEVSKVKRGTTKCSYDGLSFGQKRHFCVRERKRRMEEIQSYERRLWLIGVIGVILVLNTALFLYAAPEMRRYIRKLMNEARVGGGGEAGGGGGGVEKAEGGGGSEGGGEGGGGVEGAHQDQAVHFHERLKKFNNITAIKAELLDLGQELRAIAFACNVIYHAISQEVLQELSNISARITQASKNQTTGFCLETKKLPPLLNSYNISIFPTMRVAQDMIKAEQKVSWSQLQVNTKSGKLFSINIVFMVEVHICP